MSISDFQDYLLKYKKPLAIFVALSLLLCMVFINITQNHTAEVFIKYLGENAELGLTPNNHELNPYEISDALIVKKALESNGSSCYNYDKEKNCIEITQIPYSTTIELILKKIADGDSNLRLDVQEDVEHECG